MSKGRILKPKLEHNVKNIPQPAFLPFNNDSFVIFSFLLLEWTEYFNLEATCPNWTHDLLNMLKSISNIPKIDLLNGKFSTYRIHTHENAKPPSKLPAGVSLKDCYQMRISTSKGGIHGVFVENVFYIIWLDPLHNMYPDSRFGGLRKIKPPTTCCRDREETILKLQEEIKKLTDENRLWESELAKLCAAPH